MGITFNIAGNELKKLFFSPVAWVMVVLIMVVAGDFFIRTFFDQELMQLALYNSQSVKNFITYNYISSPLGIVNKLTDVLYLFIPLLTMGVVSREYSSGTIKLLFSSGATDLQIITGKFLGVCTYLLFLLGLALLPVVIVLGMGIESMDIPLVLTAFFGLYLMMCAYAAVGIFLSSLTSYQIVAAILGFLVLNLLNYGFYFGTENQAINKLLMWFRVPRHLDRMTMGILVSEDIFYYIIIIAAFIGFAVLRLRFRRKGAPVLKRIAGYAAVVCGCAVLALVTSEPRFMLYYDSTETKFNTLTPTSRGIISHVEDDLVIRGYSNLIDERFPFTSAILYPRIYETFEQYLRYLPRTRFEFIPFYDTIPDFEQLSPPYWYDRIVDKPLDEAAAMIAGDFGVDLDKLLPPAEIRQEIDLSGESNLSVFEIGSRSTGAKTILRIFDDSRLMPSEAEISTAIKLLYTAPKKISVLSGHGERSAYGFSEADYGSYISLKRARGSLVNRGYEIDTISRCTSTSLAATDILWIADPREDFEEDEYRSINAYIAGGGNLFITARGGRTDHLKEITAPLGISFTENILVQQHRLPMESNVIISRITENAIGNLGLQSLYQAGYSVFMPNAAGIKFGHDNGFRPVPFVMGGDGVWVEMGNVDISHYDSVTFDPQAGEYYFNNAPLVMGLEREVDGRKQRIVISGAADAFSNVEMRTSRPVPPFPAGANAGVLFGLFTWLSDGEFSVYPDRAIGSDNSYTMAIEDRAWANPLIKFILPGLIALIGLFVIMKRKGK